MLATSNIHRSISKMTIDLHKAIEDRKALSKDYGLAEREQQAQYEFSGHIGTLPAEGQITIPFSVQFVADAGTQRNSTLDRPHAKLSFEMLEMPDGAFPYAYVANWQRDHDFNYTGAIVKVGVHCPGVAIAGELPTRFRYHGILHATFQGYGTVWDPDGPLDGGGTIDDTGVGS